MEETAEAAAAAEVVLEDRAVEARRVERPAVSSEVGAENPADVPGEALERLPGRRIPENGEPVVSGADRSAGVGGEDDGLDRGGVGAGTVDRPAGCDVEEVHGAVLEPVG